MSLREKSHETMKHQVSISNLNLSSLGHLLKIFYVKLIYFCLVLTPQWSEWGACTKNRTRPDISCIASYSTDSCPMEVEREGCSSSGNSCSFEVISVNSFVGCLVVKNESKKTRKNCKMLINDKANAKIKIIPHVVLQIHKSTF